MSRYFQEFQLEDGTPDWSKAPADAQLYAPNSEDTTEAFLKIENDTVYFVNREWGMKEWTKDEWAAPEDVNEPFLVKKP